MAGCPLLDDPDPAVQLLHREGEEVPELLRLLFAIFPGEIEPLVDSDDALGDQLDLAAQVFDHDLGAVDSVRQLLDAIAELVDTLVDLQEAFAELVNALAEQVDPLIELVDAPAELVNALTELVDPLL